jgi:small GTP-binding protein
MNRYRFKVCMVGEPGVGKSSLVNRVSLGIFDDKYLTTIGLRVEQTTVSTTLGAVDLALWDLAGGLEHRVLVSAALAQSRGVFIVLDPTLPGSMKKALHHMEWVRATVSKASIFTVFNKSDLKHQWLPENSPSISNYPNYFLTSAKTGDGVEVAFAMMARDLSSNLTATETL